MKKLLKRTPETYSGKPIWWQEHGAEMSVKNFDQQNLILNLSSGRGTELIITKASLISRNVIGWFVDWEITHQIYDKIGVKGRVWFNDDVLKSAFGLSDSSGMYGNWLIERYGADVADPGKYIRWKEFLNIPCPGTVHEEDPNISILLNENIKHAVQKLFEEKTSSFEKLLKETVDATIKVAEEGYHG